MPCRDHDIDYGTGQTQREKLDKLTQHLCFLCGNITASKSWNSMANGSIALWWKNHLESDTKRVTKEIAEFIKSHPSYKARAISQYFISGAENVHPVSDWHKEWFLQIAEQELKKFWVEAEIAASIKSKLTPSELATLGIIP